MMMADPLLGMQTYVAEWEPMAGQLWLTGTMAGPAGSFELTLVDVDVVIDAADPEVVNSIRVADGASPRLLQRLIGEAGADEALAAVGSTAAIRPRIGARSARRPRATVTAEMARFVIAMSTARAQGLRASERALADLEAMVLAHRLDLHEWVPDWREALHESAREVTRADELDRDVSELAAAICRDASRLVDDDLLRSRLLHIVDRLLRPPAAAGAAAAPRQAMPAMARKAEMELLTLDAAIAFLPHALDRSVTEDSLPKLLADTEPVITRTSNDEYELRIEDWAGRADGWWVRAFSGADRVPLAVVPMIDDNGDAVARFLVTENDAASMIVDIVDDPTGVLASEQIAAFRAAVASGKRAARLERLDRHPAATVAWQRSSELHARAGDGWRAKTAAARASAQSLRIAPVVADLVGP
jgi:hypothetical protein